MSDAKCTWRKLRRNLSQMPSNGTFFFLYFLLPDEYLPKWKDFFHSATKTLFYLFSWVGNRQSKVCYLFSFLFNQHQEWRLSKYLFTGTTASSELQRVRKFGTFSQKTRYMMVIYMSLWMGYLKAFVYIFIAVWAQGGPFKQKAQERESGKRPNFAVANPSLSLLSQSLFLQFWQTNTKFWIDWRRRRRLLGICRKLKWKKRMLSRSSLCFVGPFPQMEISARKWHVKINRRSHFNEERVCRKDVKFNKDKKVSVHVCFERERERESGSKSRQVHRA